MKNQKRNFLKEWACRKPLFSVVIMSIIYLFVATFMITVNEGNVLNNGVIAMIALLFGLLGMSIREIFEIVTDMSKTKKIMIWVVFGLAILLTVLYGYSFQIAK